MLKINGLYSHTGTGEHWILLEDCASNEDEGLFRSAVDGRSLFFDLAQMVSVDPDVEVEFEFDEQIEVSDYSNFKGCKVGRFLFDAGDSTDFAECSNKYHVSLIGAIGQPYIEEFKFARKIEDKPKVNIDGILYACTESQKNKHDYLEREIKGLQNLLMGLAE